MSAPIYEPPKSTTGEILEAVKKRLESVVADNKDRFGEIPVLLDDVTDVVLRYRPSPKSQPAKQRRKKRRKLQKRKQ